VWKEWSPVYVKLGTAGGQIILFYISPMAILPYFNHINLRRHQIVCFSDEMDSGANCTILIATIGYQREAVFVVNQIEIYILDSGICMIEDALAGLKVMRKRQSAKR
jgi:hypothetical protein